MTICARPGCREPIRPGKLACRDDWFALSKDARERVISSYDRRKRHLPNAIAQHLDAVAAAIEEWKELGVRR